jgi:hypothetical protein
MTIVYENSFKGDLTQNIAGQLNHPASEQVEVDNAPLSLTNYFFACGFK